MTFDPSSSSSALNSANRFGPLPGEPRSLPGAMAAFFDGYFRFSGRASRSEYWYAMLFVYGVTLVLSLIDTSETIYMVWALAMMVPTWAVACRRLHDINRSGWWQLIALVPLVGIIVLLVFYCSAPKDGMPAAQPVYGRPAPAPVAAARSATTPAVRPAGATPTVLSKTGQDDPLEALERLVRLRDAGALSDEEFEAEKRRILNRD
jgi:uncharacterized membrane protein YhaH (DUF805 family)